MKDLVNTKIKLSDINDEKYNWLKDSVFYESLVINHDEEEDKDEEEKELSIYLCSKYTNDFEEFLIVGRFWIVNYYPLEFYKLLKNSSDSNYILDAIFNETNKPFYKFLKESLLILKKNLCTFICKFNEDNENILNYLIYAHENGCPWNENTCEYAAKNGHLECLKYVHDNSIGVSCPWDEYTCSYAAKNGHLESLKYAHENGCPWDEDTCSYAAKNGHLKCLIYAHENGCPWDEDTCSDAALNGWVECL